MAVPVDSQSETFAKECKYMETNRKLLSIKKAAESLSISPWTLRLWITQGKVASVKLGSRRLVHANEIERVIQDSTVPALCTQLAAKEAVR